MIFDFFLELTGRGTPAGPAISREADREARDLG
jgi:hypothetical protein